LSLNVVERAFTTGRPPGIAVHDTFDLYSLGPTGRPGDAAAIQNE
jgi:hypothetical protein